MWYSAATRLRFLVEKGVEFLSRVLSAARFTGSSQIVLGTFMSSKVEIYAF